MKQFLLLILMSQFFCLYPVEEVLQYGKFGNITIYQNETTPKNVILFASGDGGWNKGVIEMAEKLAAKDAVVAGFDTVHYLRSLVKTKERAYPAGDLEILSKYIQRKLGLNHYFPPILAGYSSGATLVYAALVQSPPNTFSGAISLGFCPDLAINKDFNPGYGLTYQKKIIYKIHSVVFSPSDHLINPWIVLQGKLDQNCSYITAADFVKKTKNAIIYELDNVGHGFMNEAEWLPQLYAAYQKITLAQNISNKPSMDSMIKGLPVIELTDKNSSDFFTIILTGDGGWANIDRDIGNYLSDKGIPVIGFNSLAYFWTKRTPQVSAEDINKIITYYAEKLNKSKVLIIGYSMGADILPFVLNRLPAASTAFKIKAALLGASRYAHFDFQLTDWMGGRSDQGLSILPEIENIRNIKLLFISGANEKDSIAPLLDQKKYDVIILKGGHHFSGNYQELADMILTRL